MSAGKYRDPIIFKRLKTNADGSPLQDARGGIKKEYEPLQCNARDWGEVQYLRGREYWQAQQVNAEAQGRIRLRYRTDIEPTMLVDSSGKALEILATYPADNRSRETEILFKEALD